MSLVGGGAFVRFGEEGFEGFLPARRCAATGGSSTSRARRWWASAPGTEIRLGDPVRGGGARVETPRGRVDLVPA